MQQDGLGRQEIVMGNFGGGTYHSSQNLVDVLLVEACNGKSACMRPELVRDPQQLLRVPLEHGHEFRLGFPQGGRCHVCNCAQPLGMIGSSVGCAEEDLTKRRAPWLAQLSRRSQA